MNTVVIFFPFLTYLLSFSVQFCDIMADPLHSYWTGPIIDRLLDYTGPVKLCSRITELIESNQDWVHIKEKSSEYN